MPRIRTLKPEHRQHRKVGRLTDRQYRLWVAMILDADDEGRLIEDLGALRLAAFGYHPAVTTDDVASDLDSIEESLLIRRYIVEDSSNGVQRLIWFPSWHDHQRIDRPRPSLLPPYDASSNDRRMIVERSTMARADRIGSERIGKDRIGRDRRGSQGGPTTTSRSALLAPPSPSGFDRFWAAYPKRVGKDAARKAWRVKHCEPCAETVVAALTRQLGYLNRDNGKYIPNPATWLTEGRWQDEPPERNGHQQGFGDLDMSGIESFLERHKHDEQR